MKVCSVCNEIVSAGQGCARSDCPNQAEVEAEANPASKLQPGYTGKADRFVQAGLDGADSVARAATRRAFFILAGVFAAILFAVIFVMSNNKEQSTGAVADGVDADADGVASNTPGSFEVHLTSNRLGDCIAETEILDDLDYSYSNTGEIGFDRLYEEAFAALNHWVSQNGGIERISSSPELLSQIPVPKIVISPLYGASDSVDNRCLLAAKTRLEMAGYVGVEICRDGDCGYEEFPLP